MTDSIVSLMVEIGEEAGRLMALTGGMMSVEGRLRNRIHTIRSSLAIEGNTLSIEQVTAIIDGKRILANPIEIREVKNANLAYDLMLSLNPYSVGDLLKAHSVMLNALVSENGVFHSGSVGVFDGKTLLHMAPPGVVGAFSYQRPLQVVRRVFSSPAYKECSLSLRV